MGAAGVQVGTAFAFREDPAATRRFRNANLIAQARSWNGGSFYRSPCLSTGFPLSRAPLQGTSSQAAVYEARKAVCDMGYLREPYAMADGSIGYRCAAEPVANYVAKGGKAEETIGRKCLCNALLANVGLAQVRNDGSVEPPLVRCRGRPEYRRPVSCARQELLFRCRCRRVPAGRHGRLTVRRQAH